MDKGKGNKFFLMAFVCGKLIRVGRGDGYGSSKEALDWAENRPLVGLILREYDSSGKIVSSVPILS
jgi:hypothetical protein